MKIRAKMQYIERSARFEGPALVMDSGVQNDLLCAVHVALDQYVKDRDMFLAIGPDSNVMTVDAAKRLAEEFDRKVKVMEHLQGELE